MSVEQAELISFLWVELNSDAEDVHKTSLASPRRIRRQLTFHWIPVADSTDDVLGGTIL